MIKKSSTALAYTFLVIRSIIYSSSIFFTGRLLATTKVFDVLALRFLISAVAFLLLWVFRVIKINYKGKGIKILFATAIFEPVGYFILETYGIEGTSTTITGILSASTPIFVIILERLILKETTNLKQKLYLGVSIIGVLLVTLLSGSGSGKTTVIGMVLLILCQLSGALFLVCSRKSSQKFSSMEITFFTTMVGAVVFNAINITRHLSLGTITTYFKPLENLENIIGLLFLSILSSIVATAMNNYGLSKIQASSVSALSGIGIIVSVLLGVFVNGDILEWYHIVGAVLMFIGGVGINRIAALKKQNNS